MNKKRNYYLDFWKGIACFGVVFFHTYYAFYWGDRDVGNMLKAFFRFAMPLFYMISGYLLANIQEKIEAKLYGTDEPSGEPTLLMPDEIIGMLTAAA